MIEERQGDRPDDSHPEHGAATFLDDVSDTGAMALFRPEKG